MYFWDWTQVDSETRISVLGCFRTIWHFKKLFWNLCEQKIKINLMTKFGFCAALIMKEQQVPGHPSNLKEGFFPFYLAKLPNKSFTIYPLSAKPFFQNRIQGGPGDIPISNLSEWTSKYGSWTLHKIHEEKGKEWEKVKERTFSIIKYDPLKCIRTTNWWTCSSKQNYGQTH